MLSAGVVVSPNTRRCQHENCISCLPTAIGVAINFTCLHRVFHFIPNSLHVFYNNSEWQLQVDFFLLRSTYPFQTVFKNKISWSITSNMAFSRLLVRVYRAAATSHGSIHEPSRAISIGAGWSWGTGSGRVPAALTGHSRPDQSWHEHSPTQNGNARLNSSLSLFIRDGSHQEDVEWANLREAPASALVVAMS